MNTITITYAGYEYLLKREGNHYTATCQRTGRVKNRLNPNLWHNRHNGLVTDEALIEALEAGVRELQRLSTPRGPKPPLISGGEYPMPTLRSKGRVSNREKRQNGRAE